jgi:predicted kinase
MRLKLVICKGIPASGKSTFAKSICNAAPLDWVRVCRDDIREMLGKYWVPKREFLVTSIENNAVYEALCDERNVIVDATNLNKRDYDRWYQIRDRVHEELGYQIEIEFKEFNIPLKTAIRRDWWRGIKGGRRVGKKVITNMYRKLYATKTEKDVEGNSKRSRVRSKGKRISK